MVITGSGYCYTRRASGRAEHPAPRLKSKSRFRRRLRQIRWVEWKRPRTRVANLRRLGIVKDKAYQWGNSSRAYWRVAKSPILHRALPTSYWEELGVLFFRRAWDRFQ